MAGTGQKFPLVKQFSKVSYAKFDDMSVNEIEASTPPLPKSVSIIGVFFMLTLLVEM